MHLGMSGSFRIETGGDGARCRAVFVPSSRAPLVGTHDHVVFTLSNGIARGL